MPGTRTLYMFIVAAVVLSACGEEDDSSGDALGSMCTAGMICACPDGSSQTTACDAAGAPYCQCPAPAAGVGGTGGIAGVPSSGGMDGAAGAMSGAGGLAGVSGGMGGAAGAMSGGMGGGGANGGIGGMTGGSGEMMNGGDGGDPGQGETGDVVGFTAAHNAKRAMVDTTPPLEDLVWDQDVAAVAQGYADELAANCSNQLVHNDSGYGENLAAFFGGFGGSGRIGSPEQVVSNWYNEVECWTYGTINGTETCNRACVSAMNSNGCGHYTQVVWRDTERVGCGVASCNNGGTTREYWVCNYDPPGNWVGNAPF